MKHTKDYLEQFFYSCAIDSNLMELLETWSCIPEEDMTPAIRSLYRAALRAMQEYADTWPVEVLPEYGIVRCCYKNAWKGDKTGNTPIGFLFYFPGGELCRKKAEMGSSVCSFFLKTWEPAQKYKKQLQELKQKNNKTQLELAAEQDMEQTRKQVKRKRDPAALNMTVLKKCSLIAYWQIKRSQRKTKGLAVPQGKSLQERWQLCLKAEKEREAMLDGVNLNASADSWRLGDINYQLQKENRKLVSSWWKQAKTGNDYDAFLDILPTNIEFFILPGKEQEFQELFHKVMEREKALHKKSYYCYSQTDYLEWIQRCALNKSMYYPGSKYFANSDETINNLLLECAQCIVPVTRNMFRKILETESVVPGMTFKGEPDEEYTLTATPEFCQLLTDMNILKQSEAKEESEAAAV